MITEDAAPLSSQKDGAVNVTGATNSVDDLPNIRQAGLPAGWQAGAARVFIPVHRRFQVSGVRCGACGVARAVRVFIPVHRAVPDHARWAENH